MTRPGTKGRNIRIPDDLWEPFRALAEERGSSASAEVVAFVRRYVKRHSTELSAPTAKDSV
jgi:hypothetical protein